MWIGAGLVMLRRMSFDASAPSGLVGPPERERSCIGLATLLDTLERQAVLGVILNLRDVAIKDGEAVPSVLTPSPARAMPSSQALQSLSVTGLRAGHEYDDSYPITAQVVSAKFGIHERTG
jgi:hypothetical protein